MPSKKKKKVMKVEEYQPEKLIKAKDRNSSDDEDGDDGCTDSELEISDSETSHDTDSSSDSVVAAPKRAGKNEAKCKAQARRDEGPEAKKER